MKFISDKRKMQLVLLFLRLHKQYEAYKEQFLDWAYKKVGKKRKPKFNLDTFKTEEGTRAYFQWLTNDCLKKGNKQ
jgi:hypothetical protein